MTNEDTPITIDPRLRVEEVFVSLLKRDPSVTVDVVAASNREVQVSPLHCFVLCKSIEPVLSLGQNYWADVLIGVVSNMDDQSHAERKALSGVILAALTRTEPPYTTHDAEIIHWSIRSIQEVSEDQQVADVIHLRAPVAVAS